jgi:membrane protein YdbS with pleckstrin-like domain
MSFTKQQLLPGEKLVLLARQHPFVLCKPALLAMAFLVIIAATFYYVIPKAWILLFILAPLGYLLYKIFDWRQREFVLTDHRVVKQEGVFSVSSFDAPLDKINNVFHQQSLMGRLFQYGKVGLETASEQGTTVFEFLSRPLAFKNSLVSQRELYLGGNTPASAPKPPDIPRLLEELASLRDRSIISAAEFEEKKKALLEKI